MTKDDMIRMAREAGWQYADDMSGYEPLWNFATLVAAAEREACAKLVEPNEEHRRDASWGYLGGEEGVELLDATAANIRARANHD